MWAFRLAVLLAAACAGARAGPPVRFAATGGRAFAAAPAKDDGGNDCWLVVGGRPGEGGEAALFAADGERLAARDLGRDVAYAVAVAPAAPVAAVGMASGEVLLLTLPDLASTLRWRHARPVVAVAFSPDGQWLASGGFDGVVRIAPLPGDPIALDHGAPVTCLAWSDDGQRIAAGTRDGKVRLHERSGRLLRTWQRLGGEVVGVVWVSGALRCRVRATAIDPTQERLLPWP